MCYFQDVSSTFRDEFALAKMRKFSESVSDEVPQTVKAAAKEALLLYETSRVKNKDDNLVKACQVIKVGYHGR